MNTTIGIIALAISCMAAVAPLAEKSSTIDEYLTLDTLERHYIPNTVEDCFPQLDILLTPKEREEFYNTPEENLLENRPTLSLFGDWQLWQGSRLTQHFYTLGIDQPEVMWNMIILSYHRHLHGATFCAQELADTFRLLNHQHDIADRSTALQDTLRGRYIPTDLWDCCRQLDSLLNSTEKQEMRMLASLDETILYHHGLGMWLRNNWGLWARSRLYHYFCAHGLGNPDNMSSVILRCYWHYLNTGNPHVQAHLFYALYQQQQYTNLRFARCPRDSSVLQQRGSHSTWDSTTFFSQHVYHRWVCPRCANREWIYEYPRGLYQDSAVSQLFLPKGRTRKR